jgi:hypothetical protein
MSELWVNTFKNENGNGAPDFPNGITITGVATATTLNSTITGDLIVNGDIGCGGTITYEDVARVDATGISTFREGFKVGPLSGIALTTYNDGSIRTSGVVTATQFYGGGGNLTGIDATAIQTGNTVVQTNASRIDSKVSNVGILTVTSAGINVTGVVTASSFVGDGSGLTGAGPSLANGVDNRVITASSATALNGEANLTFTSSTLQVQGGSGDTTLKLHRSNAAGSNGNTFGNILWSDSNGNTVAQLRANRATAADDANIIFSTRPTGGSVTERVYINNSGHLTPASNNNYSLGTSALRWSDLYTNDLNLSNKGSSNDIDGTWGDYKIQEGESDLFLINNRNGKKYKFNLTEVN